MLRYNRLQSEMDSALAPRIGLLLSWSGKAMPEEMIRFQVVDGPWNWKSRIHRAFAAMTFNIANLQPVPRPKTKADLIANALMKR
jgi:hypothetical protein